MRVSFACAVLEEVERRKRRLGILSYDDLLSQLADALEGADAAARRRMQHRWKFVLIDEFQDTDPVQWEVFQRAFSADHDDGADRRPQAGDLRLPRRRRRHLPPGRRVRGHDADARRQLALRPAAARRDPHRAAGSAARRRAHRRAPRRGAPRRVPARGRGRAVPAAGGAARRARQGAAVQAPGRAVARPRHHRHRPRHQAAHREPRRPSRAASSGPATSPSWPRGATSSRRCSRRSPTSASRRWSTPAGSVFHTPAAGEWLALLEAMEQPHRADRVRAASLTSFFGHTAASLEAGGDALTDQLAARVRTLADVFTRRGLAAVVEVTAVEGLTARVLARVGGERTLTDLRHIGESLLRVSTEQRLGAGRAAGLAARAGRRRQARGRLRADAPPRLRRRGRPARDHPRQQGTAVPRRLPADPVEPLHRSRPGGPAVPRRRGPTLPRRRRGERVAPGGGAPPLERGRRRVAAAALRRHDAGAVAGRRVVRRRRPQHPRLPAAPGAVRAPAGHVAGPRQPGAGRGGPPDDDPRRVAGGGRAAGGARPPSCRPTRPRSSAPPRPCRSARSPATSTRPGAARRTRRCRRSAPRTRPPPCPSPSSTPSWRPASRRPPPSTSSSTARTRPTSRWRRCRRRWRRCRSAPPSARWSTRSSSTPTRRPTTSAPSCCGSSASSWSGGRSTSTPASSPTRSSRSAPARWAPWPASAR